MTVTAVRAPEKGRVGIERVELPSTEPHQLRVRVAMSAVSPGTERASILGLENTSNVFPMKLGYSAVGTVEEVGSAVPGDAFAIGDRVACFTLAHAEVGTVAAEYSLRAPESVDDRHAALTSIGQIAMQAVRKARIELGEAVAIFGLGPIGLTALALARLSGAAPVIAIDREPARLQVARRMGADLLVNTNDKEWRESVLGATNGNGAAAVIESTGFPEPVRLAMSAAARYGRVVLLGSTRAEATINPYTDIHRPGLTIIGAHVMAVPKHESRAGFWTWQDDARCYLDLVGRGRLDLSPIMEEPVAGADAGVVYARILEWDPTILVPFLRWGA